MIQGEKLLAAEMIITLAAETAEALSNAAEQGKFSLPEPSRYFATLFVFLALAGAAAVNDRWAKLAGTFGAVAALGILLAPTAASKAAGNPRPLALSLIAYADQIISGGVQGAPIASGPNPPATTEIGPSAAATIAGGAAALKQKFPNAG